MQQRLPKVRAVNSRQHQMVLALVIVAGLMLVAVGSLLMSGGLFRSEPRSDAERDYQLLQEALKKNPGSPEVLMSLAEAEYGLGRTTDALAHAKSAVRYAKKRPAFRTRYASLLLQEDRPEEARRVVADEIGLAGDKDAEPLFLMAQIERELGDIKAAKASIKNALKLDPNSVDFMTVYGSILEKAGDKKQAAEQYRRALSFVPDYGPAIEGLNRLGVPVPKSDGKSPHVGVVPAP